MKKLKMKYLCNYKKFLIWIGVILIGLLMYKFVKKDSLIYVIYQSLPGREAGLLGGMLLGEKAGFDKDFWNQLQNSGLIHIVVVSGTNLMLVFSNVIENLAKILGRKLAIGLGSLIALGYVGMVGWQIPVVRALILISSKYWAQMLGRRYNAVRGLILSVLIIVLAWPQSLIEISFWLSFSAFIGVISSPWKGVWGTSCWVSLWVSPVLAMGFGRINLVGPISNVLILLIVEIVTLVGFLGSIIGVFIPILGKIVLWLIWPLLKYFNFVATMIGGWGWVNLEVNFNWLMLFGWYLILIWILLKIKNYSFFNKFLS
ncbi:MAG: ComEC/Rec2 family competence protein [Candidatus Shapirobacteria bacterium]